ncbi:MULTISPECIES: flavin monoamine oxidase family protein [Legionella]|uniref:Tryptophan 2-monooxygenase n=1 Tax=Legionella resiliens TaxID=2905958 RepID=A0ABS8WYQ7_9GAMM|nr:MULTISPECIES: FAD-dependent oxidoreductase [unclassified Legionella]MCE0721700.1 FAD-dependent oxidoreductase [Legionella sp. 9fVS26]MCE3530854.1 FAD-dependent oxidoreductase [Legionella sp. 8cVS16]
MNKRIKLKIYNELLSKITHLHFIQKQFICAALLLLVVPWSWATHSYDTIIIGAGVSGLTAAKQLHQAHQDVLIIEAKDRLGGRVHTDYNWGFAIDLGATWIHGIEHNPLLPLLNQHAIVPNSYNNSKSTDMLKDFALYNSEGKPVSESSLKLFSSLAHEFIHYSKTQNIMLSFEQNFTAFAQKKKLDTDQRALLHYALENIYTYEFADNLTQLSRNVYSAYEGSISSGKNALIPEGYFQLFQKFSRHIPIHLNEIVQQIDYTSEDVRVITQKETYHAKHVIITVPLGVLKSNKIIFRPSLPKNKSNAIAQLKMGNYEKLYLLFDKVFWNKDKEWIGMLPKNKEEAFNIFNYYKYTKKPVLIVFTGGKLAREMEKRGHLNEWAMQRLRMIYGANIPEPIKVKQSHWVSDPFTLGSYSYLPINVDKNVIALLAKPVAGKLYFAGEATSITDPSTVHGAYLSGLRAAHEILTKEHKKSFKY